MFKKVDFFDHLSPSSCKRSLWTPPYYDPFYALHKHETAETWDDRFIDVFCFFPGDLDLIEPSSNFPKVPIGLSGNKKPNKPEDNISSESSIEVDEPAINVPGKLS